MLVTEITEKLLKPALTMHDLVISDRKKETQRIPCKWSDIQAKVKELARAEFPEQLVKSLFPANLSWHSINLPGENLPPLVFAGFSAEKTLGVIDQARAVIQLERRLKPEDNTVYLSEIRLAGVMEASISTSKAVGITYNADGKVTKITVSANLKGPDHPPHTFKPEDQVIAGPITQAMADAAGNNYYVRFYDSTGKGEKLIPESSGYYFKSTTDYHEIGVNPSEKPLYNIEPTPWQLRIPKALVVTPVTQLPPKI